MVLKDGLYYLSLHIGLLAMLSRGNKNQRKIKKCPVAAERESHSNTFMANNCNIYI